jgi:hypothetical protein
MDEGDLAVLLYRAVHAPQRPSVELDIEHDEAAEAALRAHGEAETRRFTRGMMGGVEVPARAADPLVRRPDWMFGSFVWELGSPRKRSGAGRPR